MHLVELMIYWRPRLALYVVLGLLVAVAGRMVQLQVLQHPFWAARARAQHEQVVQEPTPRGRFFANTELLRTHLMSPVLLVHDVVKYHLWADPQLLPQELHHEIAAELSVRTGVPTLELQEHLARRSRHRKLASWLEREAQQKVLAWWRVFSLTHRIPRNALHCIADYQRSHPYGSLAGAVLHTVREIKEGPAERRIPTGGLELTLDALLRGQPSKRRFQRSPLHPLDEGELLEAGVPGADVELSLNPILQSICESALEEGLHRTGAKASWAIVLQPWTGELLALAQAPAFDPTHYRDYFNDPELTERTRVRAILDLNEPGSVLKAVTAAIALEGNLQLQRAGRPPLFLPEEKIDTSPRAFPGRKKVLKDLGLYRYLNLDMALQKSSNVYFGVLAERMVAQLGARWYREQLCLLGLEQPTGVELVGEQGGLLPRLGVSRKGRPEWSGATPYSLAMGHSMMASSLQVARVYAAIANGGLLVRPTLLRRIVRGGQPPTLLWSLEQERAAHPPARVLAPETARRVREGLQYVCTSMGGGRRARLSGYSCAGKSGTAEKVIEGRYDRTKNFSSFVGFAPVQHPQLVVFVGVDEPAMCITEEGSRNSLGGVCAAPLFREIMQKSLEYLGIPPDQPSTLPRDHPLWAPGPTPWEAQVKALNQLRELWHTGG